MPVKTPRTTQVEEEAAGSDPDELIQDSLGLQLRLALRGLRQAFRHRLAQDEIPWSVWYALRALWKTEGLTQGELAERVGVLQPNVATAVRQMQQLDLVTIAREQQDKRKRRIFLTGRAKALKRTLLPDVERLNDVALRNFTDQERAELSRLLAKLYRNVEDYAGHVPDDHVPGKDAPARHRPAATP